jgi:hypothetical protein
VEISASDDGEKSDLFMLNLHQCKLHLVSCYWEKFSFTILAEKNTRCYANGLGKWKLKLHLKHVNDTVHARGEVIKGDNLSYSSFGK